MFERILQIEIRLLKSLISLSHVPHFTEFTLTLIEFESATYEA